jgi:hypothetical protein
MRSGRTYHLMEGRQGHVQQCHVQRDDQKGLDNTRSVNQPPLMILFAVESARQLSWSGLIVYFLASKTSSFNLLVAVFLERASRLPSWAWPGYINDHPCVTPTPPLGNFTRLRIRDQEYEASLNCLTLSQMDMP